MIIAYSIRLVYEKENKNCSLLEVKGINTISIDVITGEMLIGSDQV